MEDAVLLIKRLRRDNQSALEDFMFRYTPYVMTVPTIRQGETAAAENVEELTSKHRRWLASVSRYEAHAFLRKRRSRGILLIPVL